MNKNKRKIIYIVVVLAVAFFLMFFRKQQPSISEITAPSTKELTQGYNPKKDEIVPSDDVSYLSSEDVVISYLKAYQGLPSYYITKAEARKKGWIAAQGNLCEVLQGRVIGGDYFGNFEGKLPTKKGRKYYEADVNYDCGKRNADRLIFSNDQLIFVTHDHYQTFEKR